MSILFGTTRKIKKWDLNLEDQLEIYILGPIMHPKPEFFRSLFAGPLDLFFIDRPGEFWSTFPIGFAKRHRQIVYLREIYKFADTLLKNISPWTEQ